MAKMFTTTTKEEVLHDNNHTVFGEAIKVEGTVSGNGDLIIHGNIVGTVKTSGNIVVKNTAHIKANVEANNITVAGEIHGNVLCQGQLQVQSSGKIFGDVSAQTIAVEVGAVLKGQCSAGSEQSTTTLPPDPNSKK